jgi:hypothetical protein
MIEGLFLPFAVHLPHAIGVTVCLTFPPGAVHWSSIPHGGDLLSKKADK